MFEKEYLPYCIAIGITYNEFWFMNPRIIKVYREAYRLHEKLVDEQNWMLGAYINNAVSVAIDHAFNGKKATSKYLDKPFLQTVEVSTNPINEHENIQRIEHLFSGLKTLQANFEIAKGDKGD